MEKPEFKEEIKFLLKTCSKYKIRIVFSTVFFFCLGLLYVYFRTPSYDAYASITLYEDNISPTSLVKQFSVSNILGGSGSVYNEQQMLASHTTMTGLMKKLGLNVTYYQKEGLFRKTLLYPIPYIKVSTNPGISDTLSFPIDFNVTCNENEHVKISAKCHGHNIGTVEGRLPLTFNTTYGEFLFETTEKYPYGQSFNEKIVFKSYSRAAEDYLEKIEFNIPSKLADVVNLSYSGKNKELCIDLLNGIIDEYNERGLKDVREKSYQTLKFIDERLLSLADELSNSEESVKQFKENNKIADISTDVQYVMEQKSVIEKEIISTKTSIEILNLTSDFLNQPDNRFSLIPALTDDKNLEKITEDYNSLILKRIKLEKSARPGNETLKLIDKQIDMMRENVLLSLKRQIMNSEVTLNQLQSKYNVSSSRIDKVPSQEKIYRDMMRKQTIQEQLYIFLLEQREETAMSILNAQGRGHVINEPYISGLPNEKSNTFILLGASLIGFILLPIYWYIKILYKL